MPFRLNLFNSVIHIFSGISRLRKLRNVDYVMNVTQIP